MPKKTTLTAHDVIDLQDRVQRLRLEAAKQEERRENALRAKAAARKSLTDMGIDPDNASVLLQTAYEELIEAVEELEERLVIGR